MSHIPTLRRFHPALWVVCAAAAAMSCQAVPKGDSDSLPAEPGGIVYKTMGDWIGSGLGGHTEEAPTFWTTEQGAEVIWKPGFDGPRRARVWFHRLVHNRVNDPNVPVTVHFGNSRETHSIDCRDGESGWVLLGEYDFDGEPHEGVHLIRVSEDPTITRSSAVRFDVLTDADPPTVIQSLLIDYPTHGSLVEEVEWEPVEATFADIGDHPSGEVIERLALRGYLYGRTAETFAPEEQLSAEDWAVWLHRAYSQIMEPEDWRGHYLPDEAEVTAALEMLASLGITAEKGSAMSGQALHNSLRQATEKSGRLLLESPDHAPLSVEEQEVVTRTEGAGALWDFVRTVVEAGPPVQTDWEITFREEFQGRELDVERWRIEAGSPSHILSSRWPENVEVRDGTLHLVTRKEERGGRSWTTGNIWTRDFEQKYGYFEARMQIGKASGLNNAFWLMTFPGSHPDYHFEIDVTEARYPNLSHMTVHNWMDDHTAHGRTYAAPENLSEDFHIYGLEWNETEITWFLNGIPLRTEEHDYARAASPVRLSSAIGRFAGTITDALDGTEQVVDWVRVYQYRD